MVDRREMALENTGETTILIVEDERELNQIVADYIATKGYKTLQAFDGTAAIATVFQKRPDLILLDLNLPGLAGLDVARTVTDQTDIPVIVVSARGEEEDRLSGFSVGVDDYVVKPFSLPELVMRIAAVLRRSSKRSGGDLEMEELPLNVGPIVIDRSRRSVSVDGRPVELTAAQFSILSTMAESPGRVFTRLHLLETFQDHAYAGYERTIDVHIGKIRKQIEENPREPKRLTTVWGVGYRLEEGV